MKCLNQDRNTYPCIHPLSWHSTQVSGGAPSSSSGFIWCLVTMKIGSMYIPDALKQTSLVVVVPCSVEDSAPTCFLPFPEIILNYDVETVEIPVSSQV
jgi:hypothetical protein